MCVQKFSIIQEFYWSFICQLTLKKVNVTAHEEKLSPEPTQCENKFASFYRPDTTS